VPIITGKPRTVHPGTATLIDQLDACLPQTQCTRCGYPDCRAYATALAAGECELNRCPPGGDETIAALADVLTRARLPLDASCGAHTPRVLAVIDEPHCIGCRKCIDACPVDAIVGARRLMHSVLAAECNGCGLCLPPCPVDCIVLNPVTVECDPQSLWPDYTRAETRHWRVRHAARLARLARRAAATAAQARNRERARIRADIAAAVVRVRARRARDADV
jgi:electron transport complex protein RnfB